MLKHYKIEKIEFINEEIEMIDIEVEDDNSFCLSSGIISHNSAGGMAITVRNSDTQAIYPISGKFVNCFELTPSELIKKKSISELLSIIGLKLSSPNIDNMNYGKIVIMSDMDVDGDCICALLINFFFKYWPELLNSDKLFRALSPIIKAKNINTLKIKKFYTLDDFNEVKNDYRIIEYNKGLGSLDEMDYKEMLSTLALIEIDSTTEEKLEMSFGKNVSLRKKWMLGE